VITKRRKWTLMRLKYNRSLSYWYVSCGKGIVMGRKCEKCTSNGGYVKCFNDMWCGYPQENDVPTERKRGVVWKLLRVQMGKIRRVS